MSFGCRSSYYMRHACECECEFYYMCHMVVGWWWRVWATPRVFWLRYKTWDKRMTANVRMFIVGHFELDIRHEMVSAERVEDKDSYMHCHLLYMSEWNIFWIIEWADGMKQNEYEKKSEMEWKIVACFGALIKIRRKHCAHRRHIRVWSSWLDFPFTCLYAKTIYFAYDDVVLINIRSHRNDFMTIIFHFHQVYFHMAACQWLRRSASSLSRGARALEMTTLP